MPTHVLTGATSGLGLHVARMLARDSSVHLIVGARSPDRADALIRAVPTERLSILPLDLADLASVGAFAARAKASGPFASILCVAGLQETGAPSLTRDGVETTFAANHLGHVALVEALRVDLRPGGIIVTIGSPTHDPSDRLARRFGFRGAVATTPDRVAAGDLGRSGTDAQRALDRYATSKLCAILHARHLATLLPQGAGRAYSLDPGLIPGTGLARERGALERFAWAYVLPHLRHVVSGISTPDRSARALVDLATGRTDAPSSAYLEFTGRPAPRSAAAEDDALAAALFEHCTHLVGTRAGSR